MGRVIQFENRTIERTAADWISEVLSDIDPAPTVQDILSISLGDSGVVTTLNEESPSGNITSQYEYLINMQDVIDNLLVTDDPNLVPSDIEDVSYESNNVIFVLKPIETEVGS